MSILNWPSNERPREKLLESGSQSLSDAELLALFLRVGIKGMDAVTLARHILVKTGGLGPLMNLSFEEFTQVKGLGTAKYVQLHASIELSRRCLLARMQQKSFLNSTNAAKSYFQLHFKKAEREIFAVAFLNSQYHLIGCEDLFFGTINAAQIYIREIVKKALAKNAAAVVLSHNHPSGEILPSDADRRITEKIVESLKLVDVQVLDHIIIGEGTFSFAEHGYL